MSDTTDCAALGDKLGRRGLRPIFDPLLVALLMDCTRCRAQASDPLGMWRPVIVVVRRHVARSYCSACGREHERRL